MKLSDLKRPRPTTAKLDILGDPITVTYDRAIITAEWSEEQEGTTIREKLALLLQSWDVTDDKGAPLVPPENANGHRTDAWLDIFKPLPDSVMITIYSEILADNYAGNRRGGGS